MTHPVFESATTSSRASNGTSDDVLMPATVNANDLLIILIGCSGSGTTISTPSGWTALTIDTGSGGSMRAKCVYKLADGTEDGTNVTFTAGTSSHFAAVAIRVSGCATTSMIEVNTVATGSSANPNPGSISPSWGAADTLVIAGAFSVRTYTGYPSTYSNTGTIGGGATTAALAWASKNITASSEDPGTFTHDSGVAWQAFTLAVKPAASAATITSITGSALGTVRADANCTIAGSGFEASQGSGIVEWQDVGGTWEDAQSYTSWSDTQIVCKAPLHSVGIKIGTGVSFRVTPTTNTADTDTCTFIPASGWTYETLTTTTLPAGSLAYGVTGLAVGDVVVAETSWTRSGGGDPATFAFDGAGDGTGTLTGYTADGDFSGDVDIQDATDGALTSNGPQTITIDTTAPTGYTVTIDQDVIDGTNIDAISFTFAGAEVGATYYYSFDDGVSTPVTGNGTISTATDQITGIDLSTLTNGGVTLSVYLVDTTGNEGDPVEDSATISVGEEGNVETASGLQTALRVALVSALSPAI